MLIYKECVLIFLCWTVDHFICLFITILIDLWQQKFEFESNNDNGEMFTHALNLIGDALERDINTAFTHRVYPNHLYEYIEKRGMIWVAAYYYLKNY